MSKVVILGGGPGGYEAALVARKAGADVTLIHASELGGSAVLTDVVPSKGLISVGEIRTRLAESPKLGLPEIVPSKIDLAKINARLLSLASAQSADIENRLRAEGVKLIAGKGKLVSGGVEVDSTSIAADVTLLAVGARPRVLESATPDGERIFTWEQLYQLSEIPNKLIVVGSGVTGAEFASAFHALGAEVVLISSRDRVLPSEDADAADVITEVFARRGIEVRNRARAVSAKRVADGVEVALADGTSVQGSHCLMAVGSIPNTDGIGLSDAGIKFDERGFIQVNQVSQTSRRDIYAAGDCTNGMMLASTAAMQGRIAMHHSLGLAVAPFEAKNVSANVFTDPEIATVGISENAAKSQNVATIKLPLNSNPRAKMLDLNDGFVKIFADKFTGVVLGGVIVAPAASELIYPLAMAVTNQLRAVDLANAFTIYPSLSGSVAEAARQLQL